jgi:hypothetical protein
MSQVRILHRPPIHDACAEFGVSSGGDVVASGAGVIALGSRRGCGPSLRRSLLSERPYDRPELDREPCDQQRPESKRLAHRNGRYQSIVVRDAFRDP